MCISNLIEAQIGLVRSLHLQQMHKNSDTMCVMFKTGRTQCVI